MKNNHEITSSLCHCWSQGLGFDMVLVSVSLAYFPELIQMRPGIQGTAAAVFYRQYIMPLSKQ